MAEYEAKGRLDIEMNNLTCVELGQNLSVWFSYSTVIAFAVPGLGRIKSQNIWSRTTGKHLNSIVARETLPNDEFVKRFNEVMAKMDTAIVG